MSSRDDKSAEVQVKANSLVSIIFGSHLLLVGSTIVVFAILACINAYRGVYERAESELLGAAELLGQQLESGLPVDKLQIPDTFFHRFGKAPRDQAYWATWDCDGNLVGSGGALVRQLKPSSKKPKAHGPKPYVSRAEGKLLELFVRTNDGGQLVVGRPLAKEYDAFGALVVRVLGLATASLVVTSITAYILTRWIVKPINDFAAKAESITHCELDSRLDLVQPTREMSRLAGAFNTMFETIETAFKRQKQFVADAAHELRTPVAIILSQAEYSLSRERSSDEYRQGLAKCRSTSLHMKSLIDDLMELSRLDSGQLPIDLSLLDFELLLSDVVELMKPLADKHGVGIQTKLRPVTAMSDKKMLTQILLNLVANAIEHSHDRTDVTLTLEHDSKSICIVVADQGKGISADDLPLVWNRFFRVDSARTHRTGSGSGLGLCLVRELVNTLNGSCNMESTLGEGTKVTVCIPKIDGPSEQDPREPPAS